MSSKACSPHYFQVEDWKLTGTCKNKIQTPNRGLGLPPLPSPDSSPVSLTSAHCAGVAWAFCEFLENSVIGICNYPNYLLLA